MSLPFPRPPGTPDLNKLEKMIRPSSGQETGPPGDSQNQGKPRTPHKYSWSDHIYVALMRWPLRSLRVEPPSREAIQQMDAGNFHGISASQRRGWRLQNDSLWKGKPRLMNKEIEAYAKGEPLRKPEGLKLLVMGYSVFATAVDVAFVYCGWTISAWALRRVRGKPVKSQATSHPVANEARSTAGRMTDSLAESNKAGDAVAFYQRPTANPSERVEQLVQREIYLREVFQHKP